MTMRNKNRLLRTLFLGLFILSTLQADILTEYRLHGMENLEKQLDKDLTKSSYWSNYLKNRDTSFGYIESYNNILYCNKSQSTLTLYKKDGNQPYSKIKKFSALTGKMKGDKKTEGDLKTPIGIYSLLKKLDKIDSFYGPMAFVTSYPNSYDKYRGRSGHGIWIHGFPTDEKRNSFTKGCIAIKNNNLTKLDKNIDISTTLLIINDKPKKSLQLKKQLSSLLAELYAWRYAWLYNKTEDYLNFYAKDFKRFDGVNREKFARYKRRVFAKAEKKNILFTDINVLPYPESKDLYRITFFETYSARNFSFQGDKVLIVKLEDSKMKIITEK